MICAHCSTPVPDEARFCHSCGSLVSDAEGQAAATAAMDQSSFMHMERLLREETKGVYNVQHMLGRGGMAVVYLAQEIGLSRKVALKVLPPELTFGHGVERFKREARTAAALDHPHIIPIYRIGDSGKLFWYAMKFLEGKSLEDLLRERGSLSLEETVEILDQVADALDYAHDHHVIHRDIKPANVMLDGRNRVILTDFGIAKALSEGKLTATDSVIGTPYFMSPEQGMGKPVSGRSDQYSVGVMAYRMLAGHVPFDGDSAIDILHKHCMFPAPSLHDDAPHVPEHAANAVARALAKSPEERFAHVRDFVRALKDPTFVAAGPPRQSVATVVLSPAEAAKARAGSNPAAGGTSGKVRTGAGSAASEARTVVAGATPAKPAGARPAAAPEPRSKAGLFAVLGLVVVVGGGIGYWQMSKGAATTEATPSTSAAPAPVTPAPAPQGAGTPATAGEPSGVTANAGSAPDAGATTAQPPATTPAPNPSPAATKATPTKAAPQRSAGTSGAGTSATPPVRQQPAAEPVAAPPSQPTTAPAGTGGAAPAGGAPTAPALALGTLQLRLNTPGFVEVDGKDHGERSTLVLQLSAGTHVIVVRKEGFGTQTQTVEIKAGQPTPLRILLEPRP